MAHSPHIPEALATASKEDKHSSWICTVSDQSLAPGSFERENSIWAAAFDTAAAASHLGLLILLSAWHAPKPSD